MSADARATPATVQRRMSFISILRPIISRACAIGCIISGMKDCSRRSFLIGAGAAVQAASGLVYAAGEEHSLKTVGVELYTVRSLLPQRAVETFEELDRIGYREAEMSSANLDKMWAAFQQTKLKPVAMHVDTALFAPEKEGEFSA